MKIIDSSTHMQMKLARPQSEDRRVSLECKDRRVHYSGGLGKLDCDFRIGSACLPYNLFLEGSHCLAYLLNLSARLGTL